MGTEPEGPEDMISRADPDHGTWKSGPLIKAVVLTDIHQMS